MVSFCKRLLADSAPEFSRKTPLTRFRSDESGSVLIFSLFLLFMMLIVAGFAVDLMRTETRRAQLQSTLDRAVLAGASLQQTLDSEAVVRDYFARAQLDNYLESVTVHEGKFSKTVSASALSKVDSFFVNLIGFNTLPAPARGTAAEGVVELEVSLILDVSNSMNSYSSSSGNRKIDDLKDAAQEFVYRLMCNPDTENLFIDPCTVDENTVTVNLIMYNHQVLVGEDMLRQFNITNEHQKSSCVNFSHADYFDTGISPTAPLQRTSRIEAVNWWQKSTGATYNQYLPTGSDRANPRVTYQTFRECLVNANNEIVPLSGDWEYLYDRIELIRADGDTSIDIGMKWGTALLDPSFRTIAEKLNDLPDYNPQHVRSAFLNRPKDFGSGSIDKFAVLMTDGVNTRRYVLKDGYFSGPSEIWLSQDPGGDIVSVYRSGSNYYMNPMTGETSPSPFGLNPRQLDYADVWDKYLVSFYSNRANNANAHNWLPWPIASEDNATKNANLVAMCEAARDQNVEIFSVGFETTAASTAVMKKCASSHAHHFDANGSDLDETFAAIARKIQKLRLVN